MNFLHFKIQYRHTARTCVLCIIKITKIRSTMFQFFFPETDTLRLAEVKQRLLCTSQLACT